MGTDLAEVPWKIPGCMSSQRRGRTLPENFFQYILRDVKHWGRQYVPVFVNNAYNCCKSKSERGNPLQEAGMLTWLWELGIK